MSARRWAASSASFSSGLPRATVASQARPTALSCRQRSVRASAAEKKSLRSIARARAASAIMRYSLYGRSGSEQIPLPVENQAELVAGRLRVLLIENRGPSAEPDAPQGRRLDPRRPVVDVEV